MLNHHVQFKELVYRSLSNPQFSLVGATIAEFLPGIMSLLNDLS